MAREKATHTKRDAEVNGKAEKRKRKGNKGNRDEGGGGDRSRGETRGNYTAFVSDGAFNDLSTSWRVFSSFNRPCAYPARGATRFSRQKTRQQSAASPIESNSRFGLGRNPFARPGTRWRRRGAGCRWNCSRLDTRPPSIDDGTGESKICEIEGKKNADDDSRWPRRNTTGLVYTGNVRATWKWYSS